MMRRAISLLALALVACAGSPDTEQERAAVEERKPVPLTAPPPAAKPQAVEQAPIAAVDLSAQKKPALSPLTDPASILAKRSIYYDFDRYDVKDQYRPIVEAHARYLREHPQAKVRVMGNTDERGSREYNLALGQRRAEGVKRLLVLLGARDDQVEAVSLGEEKPRAVGSNEEAWAENRRSDILYEGEY